MDESTTNTATFGSYKINFGEKIGQGNFGTVYSGRCFETGKKIAAKEVNIKTERSMKHAKEEIKALYQLRRHPNIVNLLMFFFEKSTYWIIMELCGQGDLHQYFFQNNPNLCTQISIMFQCANGIQFMHNQSNPIVHRDIKPANILLKGENGSVVIKVSDFSIAKTVDVANAQESGQFSTLCGTEIFMAPEIFERASKLGRGVDVFSLGVCFLSMIRYEKGEEKLVPKFQGPARTAIGQEMAVRNLRSEPMPELIEEYVGDSRKMKAIKQIIKAMLQYKPSERADINRVRKVLAENEGDTAITLHSMSMAESKSTQFEVVEDKAFRDSFERTLDINTKEETIATGDGIIHFMPREAWGADPPKEQPKTLSFPLQYVVFSHSADTNAVNTTKECLLAVKTLQRFAVEKRKFSDISYNFLIGNDGCVYEGRGVAHVSATAKGWNDRALSIGFIGKYVDTLPTKAAIDTAKSFLNHLVDIGKLTNDFKIHLLCDVSKYHSETFKDMFNFQLYSEISSWKGKPPRYNWTWSEGEGTRNINN